MTSRKTIKTTEPSKVGRTKFKVSRCKGLLQGNGKHWHKVAPYIRVSALAHEEGDKRYLVRLKFRNLDGAISTEFMPRQDVECGRIAVGKLLDAGYMVPGDKAAKAALLQYLNETIPNRRYVILNRSGWYEGAFVFADGCSHLLSSPGR